MLSGLQRLCIAVKDRLIINNPTEVCHEAAMIGFEEYPIIRLQKRRKNTNVFVYPVC
jgi:hypothetical protein